MKDKSPTFGDLSFRGKNQAWGVYMKRNFCYSEYMETSYRAIAVAVVFTLVFGIYSFVHRGEKGDNSQSAGAESAQMVESVAHLTEEADGEPSARANVDSNDTSEKELNSINKPPRPESLDSSTLDEEFADVQAGLDLLYNPL